MNLFRKIFYKITGLEKWIDLTVELTASLKESTKTVMELTAALNKGSSTNIKLVAENLELRMRIDEMRTPSNN